MRGGKLWTARPRPEELGQMNGSIGVTRSLALPRSERSRCRWGCEEARLSRMRERTRSAVAGGLQGGARARRRTRAGGTVGLGVPKAAGARRLLNERGRARLRRLVHSSVGEAETEAGRKKRRRGGGMGEKV